MLPRNAFRGCPFTGPDKPSVDAHLSLCAYRTFPCPCPPPHYMTCANREFTLPDLVEHLRRRHSSKWVYNGSAREDEVSVVYPMSLDRLEVQFFDRAGKSYMSVLRKVSQVYYAWLVVVDVVETPRVTITASGRNLDFSFRTKAWSIAEDRDGVGRPELDFHLYYSQAKQIASAGSNGIRLTFKFGDEGDCADVREEEPYRGPKTLINTYICSTSFS